MSHRASARFAHLLHCPMHWLHFIAALATFADDARTGKLPPPPRRLRASAVRTSKATSTQTLAATPESGDGGGPNLLVECEMRRVAFDMAMRHPSAQRHAAMIQTSLAMTACPALDFSPPPLHPTAHGSSGSSGSSGTDHAAGTEGGGLFYLDCEHGNDANTGTLEAPFKTAAAVAAAARRTSPTATARAQIIVRSGFCWLSK